MQKLEKQFHIHCVEGDVGRYVILPGDPGRCEKIAALFDNAHFVAQNREYTIYTGTLLGEKVSVCSTGIGGPSTAIGVEELHMLGVSHLIRVGTCGGMQPELETGALIIPTGAIRMEGTSQEYMPLAFPAVPDFGLTEHLVCAARAAAYDYHTGVVQCKDSFYGQHSPETMPVAPTLLQNWQAWKAAGTLASEMESAALFTVAAARHVRCATILQMLWNQERQAVVRDKEHAASDMTHAIEVAVAAMRAVIRENKETAV